MNDSAEARQRVLQLMSNTAQFHKGSPVGDLGQAMKKIPSAHQLQFLMWTFMQQMDIMSEIRDQILAEHSWTLVSTLRCRELYQSHSDKSIPMSHNEKNAMRRMISHTLLFSKGDPPKMALAGGPSLYARFSREGYSDPVQIMSSSAGIPQRMGPHPPLSKSEQAIIKVLG
jgi:hypothetical protein